MKSYINEMLLLAWIVGICVVGIYGSMWVAIVMCIVAVGGPPAARILANKMKIVRSNEEMEVAQSEEDD